MDLTTIINKLEMAIYDLKTSKNGRIKQRLAMAKLEIINAKDYLDAVIKKEGD